MLMHIKTQADMPDLAGRIALVTGATSGIGLETARMLASAGAHVILAGRNVEKGANAVQSIAASGLRGTVSFECFDMADQASIAGAADRLRATHARIDLLINNAGVMMPPQRKTTADGFELQIGTNHLGHFALTGRLLPLLQAGQARIVTVSSNAARSGRINFEDLQSERRYAPWAAYAQSKLANLLFMRRLQQLSEQHKWGLHCVAAHPGLAATGLVSSGMGEGLMARIANRFNGLLAQSASAGAMPTIAAATERGLPALSFVGPDGWGGWRGKPIVVKRPGAADEDAAAKRLWSVSENLVSLRYI